MFKTCCYKTFCYCRRKISKEYLRVENFTTSVICKYPAKATVTLKLMPDVEAKLEAEEMKHRKHVGIRKCPPVSLPEWLNIAVQKTLLKYDHRSLIQDVKQMNNLLYHRRLPMEGKEIEFRTLKQLDEMNVTPDEIDENSARVAKCLAVIKKKLRSEMFRWKPLDYTERVSVAYLVSRLAANYASSVYVFSEIMSVIPSFKPKTFFDFGSGVGSATWAAHSLWEKSLNEYFCVDASPAINSLCECLLRGGEDEDDENEKILKNVYFRQFLPASNKLKYDLVVSAFSLMDLPSFTDRLRVIDTLWQKTSDILVIIESGGRSGFSTILDARDYILEIENKNNDSSSTGAHIVVPCPHEMACPLFTVSERLPCQFSVRYYQPSPLKAPDVKTDVFTYVVLRRGAKQQDLRQWPRIVQPILKGSRKVQCRLCCNDGKFQDLILTKKKHGNHLYKCTRKSSQGDLLPVDIIPLNKTIVEQDDIPNTKETDFVNN